MNKVIKQLTCLLVLVMCLLQTACVNTMQAYLDKNFPQFKAYPVKEALLAEAFQHYSSSQYGPDGYDPEKKNREQMQYFSKSEEDIAQKAMSEKSNIVTTWTNKEYGELEFRVGSYFKHRGWKCRNYNVTWIDRQSAGIFKYVEESKACLNPQTGRWEVYNFLL